MAKATNKASADKTADANLEKGTADKAAVETNATETAVETKATINVDAAKSDSKPKSKAKKDDSSDVVFEFEGKKYGFTKQFNGKLQVNGKVYTTDELLKNTDALQFLIVGNSPFIKKL